MLKAIKTCIQSFTILDSFPTSKSQCYNLYISNINYLIQCDFDDKNNAFFSNPIECV